MRKTDPDRPIRRPAPLLQSCLLWACLLGCLLGCFSCAAAPFAVVEQPLSLPALPSWLRELDAYYRIEWFDRDGRLQRRDLNARNRTPVVALPRMQNVPILVYPVIAGFPDGPRTYLLLPGGAIFPAQVTGAGYLRLTWEAGPAALVMQAVVARTGSPRSYSAQRLHDELLIRTDGDPWRVDLDTILELLLAGAFRVTAIRRGETFELNAVVAAGEWFSHNLLASPVTAHGNGAAGELNVSLVRGLHRYFHESGRMVLTISVEEDGTIRWAQRHR